MALSKIQTSVITDNAITTAKVNADAITNAKIADDAIQTENLNSGVNLGRRNIVINGAMQINQRGNTTGNGVSGGSGVYSVDRWNLYHSGSEAVANLQQSTDVPSGGGFGNSYLIDVTTAESSVAAGEIAVLRQILEGYNLQGLKYGTSSAESVTLSFWVKSPKTGVHICELYHNASTTKTQSQSYTVNSANTWEKKIITFVGDTAATLDNDNQYTIAVQWGIFAGTTYTSGTLQTSWANLNNANRFVGQQNLFDNTSNNFYLTGVQFEVGSQATPFEHRSFAEELQLCQRYFESSYNTGTAPASNTSAGLITTDTMGGDTTTAYLTHQLEYRVSKRSAPTLVIYDQAETSGKVTSHVTGVSTANNQSISTEHAGDKSISINRPSGTAANGFRFHYSADAEL